MDETRFLNEVAFPKEAEAHPVISQFAGKPRVLPAASSSLSWRRRDSKLTLRSTLCQLLLTRAGRATSILLFAMSAAGTAARQQLRNIAAHWPADPFRPNVQLKTLLTSLAEHPNLTSSAVRATQALQRDEFKHKVRISNVTFAGFARRVCRMLHLRRRNEAIANASVQECERFKGVREAHVAQRGTQDIRAAKDQGVARHDQLL